MKNSFYANEYISDSKRENSENIATKFPETLKFTKKSIKKNLKWKYSGLGWVGLTSD